MCVCVIYFRAAIAFGAVTVVAGIAGTLCGSELAKFLSRHTRKAEALVCSISLLTAVPFLFISLAVVQYQIIYLSWVTVFLAIFCVCLNWTPVSAMLLVRCESEVGGICVETCLYFCSTPSYLPEEPLLQQCRSCSHTAWETQSVPPLLER